VTSHEIILPIATIAILVLSLSVHEAAHAWVAYKCGDDTAKNQGRLTLNPIEHLDPVMSILVPLGLWVMSNGTFIFGGARPVPVYYPNLGDSEAQRSRNNMWVALAGPVSNFLQAFVLILVFKLVGSLTDYSNSSLLMRALSMGVMFNVALGVFNLIPFPPLDGSRVLHHLAPPLRPLLNQMEGYGIFLLVAVFWIMPGATNAFLGSTIFPIVDLLDTITGGTWS